MLPSATICAGGTMSRAASTARNRSMTSAVAGAVARRAYYTAQRPGYAGRRKGQQVAPLNRDFVEENAVFVESGEQPLPAKPA